MHRAVRSLHRITSPAAKVEAKPDDRGETIVLRILEPRHRLFFFFFSSPSSSSSLSRAAVRIPPRVRRITAINYEGGRPKEVAQREEEESGIADRGEKRRVQLALHTISTCRGPVSWRYLCAKIKCRCVAARERARALRCALHCATRDSGDATGPEESERKRERGRHRGVEWSRAEQSGSEVLINISPGFEARLN